MITPYFPPAAAGRPRRAVILLSGGGSNAGAILRYCRENPDTPFSPVVLATDAPENSAAKEIARTFDLPLICHDLRKFYADNGESMIKLDTPHRRELRDQWSMKLRELLQPYRPDFALLAGFVPLTNLNRYLPCLNVHPGDLTVEDGNGRRIFAGLHYLPVEYALLNSFTALRSSVILTRPFTGKSDDIDAGPVLGISPPMPVDTGVGSVESLQKIAAARTSPPYRDRLREIAGQHIERLKTVGDHVVFPRAAADFAAGLFGSDENDRLYYRTSITSPWQRVRTVEYSADAPPLPVCELPPPEKQ